METNEIKKEISSIDCDVSDVIGLRIELKWSSGKWYRGTVTAWDEKLGKHKVLYDDGDRRWYHLPEMLWRPVPIEDEYLLV